MIKVENLTKDFIETKAVDNISFEVNKGEVVGFLGPNGAGKTTTMRIITGFIPATSGTVLVDGYDVFKNSLEVRKTIGYLPESAPLYQDMRVAEYLKYRAQIKRVPGKEIKETLSRVMEKCMIGDVSHRIIGHLSKGYKQRVGLADSLLHNPKVLILDEPTVGLDPNQIRQVRSLIKDLAREHTIILSTHILPEAQAICSRIMIINEGKIAAGDTPENLIKLHGKNILNLELKAELATVKTALMGIDGLSAIVKVAALEDGFSRFSFEMDKVKDVREAVFKKVVANNLVLREMILEKISLEDIFVKITTEEEGEANNA